MLSQLLKPHHLIKPLISPGKRRKKSRFSPENESETPGDGASGSRTVKSIKLRFHLQSSFSRKFLKYFRRMTRGSQPPRSNKPSIKYGCSPLERASFELTDFDDGNYAPTSSGNGKQNSRKSEPKSSEILSTAELISAVGQIWNCASRSLDFFQPKSNLRHNDGDFQEENVFRYSGGKGNGWSSTSSEEGQHFPVNLMTTGHSSSPMVQENLECLKVSKKISFFEPHNGNYTHSLLRKFMQGGSNIPNEPWKEKSSAAVGVLYDLRNMYGWMTEIPLSGLKHQVNSTQIKSKKTGDCCLSGYISPTSCCNVGDTGSPANNPTIKSADCHTQLTKCKDSSSGQSTCVAKAPITSLCSDYFPEPPQSTEANGSVLRTPILGLHALDDHAYKECQHKNEDAHLYESKKNQQSEFIMTDKSKIEISSPTNNKLHYGLAKQEHAFAGALAGVFVSLCLHPMDTIKTVIQSCHADQRSFHYIGRSIISERGVKGLYRGIASNIACSAPISAVYTFTYESAKGAFLPFFPKEYRSIAHCMAGGCASVATSFIFTPSERVKQQMQVGSHYQNCWNALVGIIKKGGLPSLYAGWGAVLCRNVPHSVIKFYTYESLKQLMLSSQESNAQPNTLQTLICGGLAGSTAALFTTPFDVVKTRLQTRIPGSIHQYDGVFNTLKEIAMHEGLKGLYRGLVPRLVMYISQGAIFFASYESFKRLFSLEVPQLYAQSALEVPQLYAKTVKSTQNKEDEAP
ncbi:hypothetical protein ACSBR2_041122 [Camellia fascicularis]